jgi:hypothetical protein
MLFQGIVSNGILNRRSVSFYNSRVSRDKGGNLGQYGPSLRIFPGRTASSDSDSDKLADRETNSLYRGRGTGGSSG